MTYENEWRTLFTYRESGVMVPGPPVHLFFDLDGTLTDSREGILASLRHALRLLGREPPPDAQLMRFIGPPTHDAFPELLGSRDPVLVERAIALYRERYSEVGLFEASVYPGVAEGVAALSAAGHSLRVVTSKPRIYADRMIDHFGLRPFFVEVCGSELDGSLGDKGDLIAHVLAARGLPPQSTWMFGDRKHDIAGARRNGVHGVGVLWGYGSRDELEAAGAERVYASMGELVAACGIDDGRSVVSTPSVK
jgi:phosphoglycolate phosphatase